MSSGFNEADAMLLESIKTKIRGSNSATIVLTQNERGSQRNVADERFGWHSTPTEVRGDSGTVEHIPHGLEHRHAHGMDHQSVEASC
jgi:hypothetical protein